MDVITQTLNVRVVNTKLYSSRHTHISRHTQTHTYIITQHEQHARTFARTPNNVFRF